ncbi:MAG: glutathione peroxidase [Eubacteriales bacterium]
MNIFKSGITFKDMAGKSVDIGDYEGRVLLIVNTASKCGFTPQFEGLEALYSEYKEEGLVILGFPCNQFAQQDPGTESEILSFCQVNYGVSFPMNAKIDVNGENRHPLYAYLIDNSPKRKGKPIKWNFEKFLVGKDGEILDRYLSIKKPESLKKKIEKALKG